MDGFNPYAPPTAQSDGPVGSFTSGDPLFTEKQVAVATFLGSPFAGFILMAMNERRLGRPQGVAKMLGLGVGATVIVVLISLVWPPQLPGLILSIAYIMGMQQIARAMQGTEIDERLSLGTPKGSGWVVFGVGMACLLVVAAVVVAMIFADPSIVNSL